MMIRPATPADLPALAALHAANWRTDYAGLLPEAVLGAQVPARRVTWPDSAALAARLGAGVVR